MGSERRKESDKAEASAEVLPGDIVTSRGALEAGNHRSTPGRAAKPKAPLVPHRLSVTGWPDWAFFSVLAAIFLTFGIAISMDKSTELPRTFASAPLVIGELHPNISHVNESTPDDGALEITLVQMSPTYSASVVTEFASDALVVLQRMQKFFPQIGNRIVRFVAKAPLHSTGREVSALVPVLSLDFERSQVLAKAIAPEFTFQDLLNEASAVHYLHDVSGHGYVEAFCRDELSRSATIFCEAEDRTGEPVERPRF